MCQIEIPVTRIDRALAFYREAFGWERSPAEIHEYVVLEVPEGARFGLSLVPRQQMNSCSGPTMYFAVDDPESIVAQVIAAGGRCRFGPRQVAGYGTIWQVEDPDGNCFGLYRR